MAEIEEILRSAMNAGASDIHLTVGVPPVMRVNGGLKTMDFPVLTPENTQKVLNCVATERGKQVFETSGESDFSVSIPSCGRFRVNAYRQRGSAALAFRIVKTKIPTTEELGLPDCVTELYQRRRGLILVTGPTGSGKSTTQAALIDKINRNRTDHIITLEDPIEFLHRHEKSIVNQREIGIDSDNFASALRAAMREDPDVIFVGEMRDLETISVALTAAETGHLVLSTLHTPSASAAIDRIVDVFPAFQQQQIRVQLAGVLLTVVYQQLVPMSFGRGRAAAFEVLIANPAVRNLIREGKTHQLQDVIQTNRNAGMISMDDALMQLHSEGKISRETAMLYAINPNNMKF